MNLKTSLFNKSIMKSDFKRFWWVSALKFLAIMMFMIYPIYERYFLRQNYNYLPELRQDFAGSVLHGGVLTCVIFIAIFGVSLAFLLFSYLNSSNTVSFAHGLPIKRETHFATHFLSGLTILMIPAILSVFIMFIMKINPIFNELFKMDFIFKWLWVYFLYTVIVFSGTVFVATLTGNSLATIVITGAIAILPLLFTAFSETLLSENLYGYFRTNLEEWLIYIYVEPQSLLGLRCLIYIIASIVLITASVFIYKARHLENNGEIVAFLKLKNLFVYGVAICLGAVGYMYCEAISSDTASLWWILPFGLLGVVISFMLSKKSFNLKGIHKPAIIYTVIFAVFFAVVEFDLTGYEKRVPEIEDIESVSIVNESDVAWLWTQYGEVRKTEVYDPVFKDKEDIKKVTALHKYLIENREIDASQQYESIPVIYNLKNGKTIKRQYVVPKSDCKDLLKAIYETKEMKYHHYKVTDPTEKKLISITVNDKRLPEAQLIIYENQTELLEEIHKAFMLDIENLKYEDDYEANAFVFSPLTTIKFNYTRPSELKDGTLLTAEQEKAVSETYSYNINKNYVNTMAKLEELGVLEQIPDAGGLVAMGASVFTPQYNNTKNGVLTYTSNDFAKSVLEPQHIDDMLQRYRYVTKSADEISQMYDYIMNEAVYDTNRGPLQINFTFLTSDSAFEMTLYYDDDKLPENIKTLIEKINTAEQQG